MGLNQRKQKENADARNDFWSTEGDFIYRYHNELRVQLHVPKEDSFPIPLKYIDVTRSTHTNLDVMQENVSRIIGNVDGDRTLSDSWIGPMDPIVPVPEESGRQEEARSDSTTFSILVFMALAFKLVGVRLRALTSKMV